MKVIKTDKRYKYCVGIDEFGKTIYNIVPKNEDTENIGGYYSRQYIEKEKNAKFPKR